MPPRAAKILFYYDIVSPYSRLAFEFLQKYKHSVWGDRVDIDYIVGGFVSLWIQLFCLYTRTDTIEPSMRTNTFRQPFLLGGVMKMSQNVPPGSNPLKAKYLRSGRCAYT